MGMGFLLWKRLKRVLRKLDSVDDGLSTITVQLQAINERLEKIMAVTEDTKALVTKLNDATNAVAEEVKHLQDKIPAPGSVITEADAKEIDAGLQGVIDRLTVMGQDPNNPVPPAP